MNGKNNSNLQALEICHYIWGGLICLMGLFPLIYVAFGIAFVSDVFGTSTQGGPPAEFGYFFIAIGLFVTAIAQTVGILNIFSGRNIRQRRGKILTMVLAGLNCFSVPFGTILGVFTLVILSQEDVAREYSEAESYSKF